MDPLNQNRSFKDVIGALDLPIFYVWKVLLSGIGHRYQLQPGPTQLLHDVNTNKNAAVECIVPCTVHGRWVGKHMTDGNASSQVESFFAIYAVSVVDRIFWSAQAIEAFVRPQDECVRIVPDAGFFLLTDDNIVETAEVLNEQALAIEGIDPYMHGLDIIGPGEGLIAAAPTNTLSSFQETTFKTGKHAEEVVK